MPCSVAQLSVFVDVMLFGSPSNLDEELKIRQGGARVYYAAFHTFRDAIAKRLNDHTYKISHEDLIDWLFEVKGVELRELATLMYDARKLRNECDYDFAATVTSKTVKNKASELRRDVLNRASQIDRWVKDELREPPRSGLKRR